jgi:hypothetical protein
MFTSSIPRFGSALAAVALGGLASAQISFQPAVNYPAGESPQGSCTGDFNGDNRLDIAVASVAPDGVRILTNVGNGAFVLTQTIPTGAGTLPHMPVAGRLDPDTDVDIAVTLTGTDRVLILVNNGGVFTLGPSFIVGDQPEELEIGYTNSDLNLDLVSSNHGSDTVSVLTNLGNLSFGVANVPAGDNPRGVEIEDITGDGERDIIVASEFTEEILILGNTGNGTFALLTFIDLQGLSPVDVFVGLVNADMLVDILAVGYPAMAGVGNSTLAYVRNLGNVTFALPVFTSTEGFDPTALGAADFDLDGDRDVVVSHQGSDDIAVLTGDGQGGFSAPALIAVGDMPVHLIHGDFDEDGARDVATTNLGSDNQSVLINQTIPDPCQVTEYCVAKMTSIGTLPDIGWTGTPSATTQDFFVTISNALPNVSGLAFFGETGRASLPFQGGTLCVDPPVTRLPVQTFSQSGSADYHIPVDAQMVGNTWWFQWWFRDPNTQSTTGLSNALEVKFCN